MSDNRMVAQAIYKAVHQYVMNTFPLDTSLGAEEAKAIRKKRADGAASKVADEIVARGKPMGVCIQYDQHWGETKIYVFYHPNPSADKVW